MLEQPIVINDRVAMSVQWLKSTGQMAGEAGHMRGVVQTIRDYGDDISIATVAWDSNADRFPAKINVKNLAKVGLNDKFSSC